MTGAENTEVLEIRVHGIANAPPAEMLEVEASDVPAMRAAPPDSHPIEQRPPAPRDRVPDDWRSLLHQPQAG